MKKRRVVKLSEDFREDVRFWIQFLSHWCGTRLVVDFPEFRVWIDACKTGYGGHWGEEHLWGWWFPKQQARFHSNWKELTTALLALRRWGHRWKHSRVTFFSDNTTSVVILNKGSSLSKELMRIERQIATIALTLDIEIHTVWIPGVTNTLADALSRREPPQFGRHQSRKGRSLREREEPGDREDIQ